MDSIFKNRSINERFNLDGYVIVPMLSHSELNVLNKLYESTIKNEPKHDLYESSRMNPAEINNNIKSVIQTTLFPHINEIFQNYSFYGGTFMIKAENKNTELPLHQDWSVIEEDYQENLLIWIPLHDISPKDGGIFLIKGSHKFFNNYRSGSYRSNRIERRKIPKEFIKDIYLKAGEVLIYSTKIFHGSHTNTSKNDRLVATAMITSKNAPLVYYHKKSKNEAEVYLIEPSSYLNDIIYISEGKVPPKAILLKTIPYKHILINHYNLIEKLTGIKFSLINKIKHTISTIK